ncbi:MAG: hypothetical protein KA188_07170 [Leadbetterella sp.]|nr:hypothetical protein [Leadbetterella sp.]
MDDLDLIKKKTGMTIGTAWILMFSSMALMFLLAVVYGILGFVNKKTFSMNNSVDLVMVVMVLSFLIFALIGFFINKKELPYFAKVSPKILLILFVIAMLWSVIASFFLDYYLNKEKMEQMEGISRTWWFAIILNTSMMIFQIGVIGHGLLRNYNLKKSMIAISFICIVFYMPAAVSSMIIQSMILLYVYYRTASFLMVLYTSTLMFMPDYLYRSIFEIHQLNYNFYKNEIFPSPAVYYVVWVLAIFALSGALWYLKQNTKVIKWERDEESIF